ncbi:MAG TPA: DNA-formamidopyrimidine glycosylase family protein [Woeseiaceae bacterium]|nr:DNA-formamidopyrimidine glycosylase family protein [Woeseiaceae bacterium]
MPELPDIDVYVVALQNKLSGCVLREVRLGTPFLLRSVEPPLAAAHGHAVTGIRRIGKRIALKLDNDLWLVLHLMVGGRLHWHSTPPSLAAKNRLASFDFATGSLLVTEAGTRKRASLALVAGDAGLASQDPGGVEPLECDFAAFRDALTRENHTLKRALTDPHLVAGIGNAYSDEILHAARLSPVRLTKSLDESHLRTLYDATREVLREWRERLLEEAAGELPEKVTAFRPEMRVHGRYGEPCRVCGAPVQRIRYKDNETNYCARCQTESRLLKDRALSRLLKADWPTTL